MIWRNSSVKVWYDTCMQVLWSWVHKLAWFWASLKVQKGHTKVSDDYMQDIDLENIPVKLQYDIINLWRVTLFTRCCWKSHSTHLPRQRQYPSSLRGWEVKRYKGSFIIYCGGGVVRIFAFEKSPPPPPPNMFVEN